MKVENVKVDFQSTGWVVEKDRPARFGPLSRRFIAKTEDFPKSLHGIADFAYREESNRAMVLLNYYQAKYERVVEEGLAEVKKHGIEAHDDHRDTFVGLTRNKGKSWLYVIRGREYLCREGHLIAAATPTSMPTQPEWYKHGPKLEDVIAFEKERDAILIPSHPLSKFGLAGKLVLRAIREPSGTNLGLGENAIRKHAKDFDALEAYSLSMSPKQTEAVDALATELGLPTVSNTDKDIRANFEFFNLFDWLDFTNPEALRQSIRAGLKRQGNNYREVRGAPGEKHSSFGEQIAHILLNVMQGRQNF